MTLDRSWEDEWRAAWLSDAAYTSTLDGWVRRRMIVHHVAAGRGAHHESVGPWTVDGLVSDVHRHAVAGRWLWATTAICFVQELLFCIDDGGVDMSRHLSDFTDVVKTLRYLRNVIAHPANMPVEGGENSVDEFSLPHGPRPRVLGVHARAARQLVVVCRPPRHPLRPPAREHGWPRVRTATRAASASLTASWRSCGGREPPSR